MSTTDRVAVVVVHGIADQRPGQTVREVARLLCQGWEGSPLRDLYAERFPLLYRWMGSREAGFADAAPAAADLGVTEWVNACRSGDYVGRFLWTPDRDAARFGAAMVGPDGRVEARRAGDRTEFCLGAGGHTHYFSNDAVALAVEIERVVAGAGAKAAAVSSPPARR